MKLNGKTWWKHDDKKINWYTAEYSSKAGSGVGVVLPVPDLSQALAHTATFRNHQRRSMAQHGAAWRSMALCWKSWVRWVGRISEYLMRWAETDKLTGENWWADVCRVPQRAATAEKMNCMMKPCKNCQQLHHWCSRGCSPMDENDAGQTFLYAHQGRYNYVESYAYVLSLSLSLPRSLSLSPSLSLSLSLSLPPSLARSLALSLSLSLSLPPSLPSPPSLPPSLLPRVYISTLSRAHTNDRQTHTHTEIDR